jgi:Phytanoyl-CoA dioxygenase (PhyH)
VTATATSLTTLQSQRAGLYRDGIVSLPGCFEPTWADRLHEDFEAAFRLARSYPGGTISRGPERYYFAVHPEHIRGFVDLISHPAVARLSEYVLGTDYEVVELGFDVPLAGAKNQPWHRDFPSPPATSKAGRLTSLAFNVTTVDVTRDLAPLEIALGTHFDDGSAFEHGMFPPPEAYGRYEALASRRYPRRGDVSARTGLTVHRGTENHSNRSRAVLILGVVAGSVSSAETAVHDLQMTGDYYDSLPDVVQQHLRCTVVDELVPIVQKHDIEGLMMGG